MRIADNVQGDDEDRATPRAAAINDRAHALAALHRPDEALATFRLVTDQFPGSANAHLSAVSEAVQLLRLGRSGQAYELIESLSDEAVAERFERVAAIRSVAAAAIGDDEEAAEAARRSRCRKRRRIARTRELPR